MAKRKNTLLYIGIGVLALIMLQQSNILKMAEICTTSEPTSLDNYGPYITDLNNIFVGMTYNPWMTDNGVLKHRWYINNQEAIVIERNTICPNYIGASSSYKLIETYRGIDIYQAYGEDYYQACTLPGERNLFSVRYQGDNWRPLMLAYIDYFITCEKEPSFTSFAPQASRFISGEVDINELKNLGVAWINAV